MSGKPRAGLMYCITLRILEIFLICYSHLLYYSTILIVKYNAVIKSHVYLYTLLKTKTETSYSFSNDKKVKYHLFYMQAFQKCNETLQTSDTGGKYRHIKLPGESPSNGQ